MSSRSDTVTESNVDGFVTTTWKSNSPPGSGNVDNDSVDFTIVNGVDTSDRSTVWVFESPDRSTPSESMAVTDTVFVHDDGKSPVWFTVKVHVNDSRGDNVHGASRSPSASSQTPLV